ncbi:MAG: SET domain-containing protein-lysine N-methyltransferase [Bacteroidota bacterium]
MKFSIFNGKSQIEGKGAFAAQTIPGKRKIGNLGGEIISLREARKRAAATKRVAMVEFGNGKALDGSVNPNALRYINHSCGPNCYMRVRFPLVEFYTLREIQEGEELSCNYGETHHDGKLPCRCGSDKCRGFI